MRCSGRATARMEARPLISVFGGPGAGQMVRKLSMRAIAASLLFVVWPIALLAGPPEVKDPIGDAGFSPIGGPAPDLRAASVVVTSHTVALRVRFARGTFDPRTTFVQFSLIVGQGNAGEDICQRCGNYLVEINGIGRPMGTAELRQLDVDSKYRSVGTLTFQTVADGVNVAVPRSRLADDLRHLTYRGVTCVRLGDDAISAILDSLPNDGMASATLEVR